MAAYKSIVAYDGTDFQGFQRQAEPRRTVQAVLETALHRLGWQGSSLLAAGRTDAGVHARGQVIGFDLDWPHALELLGLALNAHLPRDVSVRDVTLAEATFHPRFSAQRRVYSYALLQAPARDPLRERYAWRVWPALDLGRMAGCAKALIGAHDFGAFGRAPIPGGHTRRRVFRCDWSPQDDLVLLEIEADAFLYRMVRRAVAVMVEVGAGRMPVERVGELLGRPHQAWMGKIAPARGLCLESVVYDSTAQPLPDDGG